MIKQTYEVDLSLSQTWAALTDQEMISQWSGAPATMEAKEGAEFSLWGGDIHGTNTKVVPNERLEQDWYGGEWDKPSKVVFRLEAVGKELTNIHLTHTDLPKGEEEEFAEGWEDYYLGVIGKLVN